MSISYKLDNFEGPLDVLLNLIEKNKVNIYDIPIVLITEQYLDYVDHMETEDLNIVSEFLVMAATLIDIKCRMLLPKEVNEEGEEEDPRAELVSRLLEYKMYKYMALELRDMEDEADKHMYREADIPEEVSAYEQPVDYDQLFDGVTLAKLQDIFNSVVKRQEDKIDPIRSKFSTIPRDNISVEKRINSVLSYAREHRSFSFRQMLEGDNSREELVVTFLAVLELMRMGKIYLTQDHLFDDMQINTLEPVGETGDLSLEGLDKYDQ